MGLLAPGTCQPDLDSPGRHLRVLFLADEESSVVRMSACPANSRSSCDLVEYWAARFEPAREQPSATSPGRFRVGLGIAWYRDVLRAKMVSLRLPRRLLVEYKQEIVTRSPTSPHSLVGHPASFDG